MGHIVPQEIAEKIRRYTEAATEMDAALAERFAEENRRYTAAKAETDALVEDLRSYFMPLLKIEGICLQLDGFLLVREHSGAAQGGGEYCDFRLASCEDPLEGDYYFPVAGGGYAAVSFLAWEDTVMQSLRFPTPPEWLEELAGKYVDQWAERTVRAICARERGFHVGLACAAAISRRGAEKLRSHEKEKTVRLDPLKVRELRRKAAYSPGQLAQAVGLRRQDVETIETEGGAVTLRVLHGLAFMLNCIPADLRQEDGKGGA